MKAAVYRGPQQLAIEEVAEPAAPGPGEVLIEVSAASLCGTDAAEWSHGPVLAQPPVILGHEFVGRVVASGGGPADRFLGARVTCGAGISCGMCRWCRAGRTNLCDSYATVGLQRDGGLAEFVVVPAAICAEVPAAIDDISAAMAQPLAVAMHAVRRGDLSPGGSCVIIGCGGIGAFAVTCAVAAGAQHVIAVDLDANRLRIAQHLGATATVESLADVQDVVFGLLGPSGADCVLEASGAADAPALALSLARRGGTVVQLGLHRDPLAIDLLALSTRELDLRGTVAHVRATDLDAAIAVLASSDVAATVLGDVIRLDDLLEKGIVPLAERRATGKVVVDFSDPAGSDTRLGVGSL